jgi:DNA-directed RNA polymerase specialized sigma24 family protein
MSLRPSCCCPVCELESALLAKLHSAHNEAEYQKFASPSSVLSAFSTCNELLLCLRESQKTDNHASRSDETLGELLRISRNPVQEIGRHLVLLILMPAIHRTSTQIIAGFPSLMRDDIAQHLVTSVLDIANSQALQAQTSHFAFTITRAMRRSAFRWALREADFAAAANIEETVLHKLPADVAQSFEPKIILGEFLSRCLSRGLLSPSEHELLVLFKIQGISSEVLAARYNVSEVAFRHRMQRVLDRLRRAARPRLMSTQPDDAAA